MTISMDIQQVSYHQNQEVQDFLEKNKKYSFVFTKQDRQRQINYGTFVREEKSTQEFNTIQKK